MEALAIVTILVLLQAFLFALQVGKARASYGVDAPAISGNTEFERVFRVHQNTLEQLVLFLPSLWIFGYYVNALVGAALGIVFIIGRFVYRNAYVKDPAKRSMGFQIGALSMMVVMIGGVIGAVVAMIRS